MSLSRGPRLKFSRRRFFAQVGKAFAAFGVLKAKVAYATYYNLGAFWKKTTTVATGAGLYTWGDNANGTLGVGNTTTVRSSPGQVGSLTTWTKIVGGDYHFIARKSDGTLWSWGTNSNGQLGLGDLLPRSSPVQIGTATDWHATGLGASRISAALKTTGQLYTWGYNAFGGLALGDALNRSAPTQVGAFTDGTMVSPGPQHLLLVRAGALYAAGINNLGQLGDGTVAAKSSLVQIGTATDWISIAAGGNHSLGIRGTTSGTLYAWGTHGNGQLGTGGKPGGSGTNRSSPTVIGAFTDWTNVFAGYVWSYGIRGGALYAWGDNTVGQLGLGDLATRSVPSQVGAATDWTLVQAVTGAQNGMRAFGIRGAGTLWTMGDGQGGGNGLNNLTTVSVPTQIGADTNWASVATGYFNYAGGIRT